MTLLQRAPRCRARTFHYAASSRCKRGRRAAQNCFRCRCYARCARTRHFKRRDGRGGGIHLLLLSVGCGMAVFCGACAAGGLPPHRFTACAHRRTVDGRSRFVCADIAFDRDADVYAYARWRPAARRLLFLPPLALRATASGLRRFSACGIAVRGYHVSFSYLLLPFRVLYMFFYAAASLL